MLSELSKKSLYDVELFLQEGLLYGAAKYI